MKSRTKAPSMTNHLIAGDLAALVEQNQCGLITDWELICAASVVVSNGVTPKEGDIDPSTGLKYPPTQG